MAKIKRKQIDLKLTQEDQVTGGIYGTINSPNLQETDTMEGAFDKVTNILDALVPPNAPTLGSMSAGITGTTGNLSFGSSNNIVNYDNHPTVDANQLYSVSGTSRGIVNETANFSATLANNVSIGPGGASYGGSPSAAYEANAFGNADQGNLELYLDGNLIHTVDLSTFVSGSSTNANGSGFNLSAAQPSKFATGTDFNSFQFRTGTVTVDDAEWNSDTAGFGYKTVSVVHDINGTTYDTQTYNFVVDANNAAITASGASFGTLNMSGSRDLSGVTYHQSGTTDYSVTLSGVYPATYEESGSAISFSETRATVPNLAIPAFSVDEDDDVVISNRTVTISSSNTRILNQGISVSTTVDRTVQGNASGLGSVSSFNLLLDTVTSGSTDTNEAMNTETYRVNSGIESDLNATGYGGSGGPSINVWDSSLSLVGGDADHNDGLLIHNGQLTYPTVTNSAVSSGDFSAVADGPAGNPNYSSATGTRYYYRMYRIPSASNFVLNLNASSTTVVATNTTLTGNEIHIELLAPSQTSDGSTTEWKDSMRATSADSDPGAYAATYGSNVGATNGSDWGLTIGTKTTANSGDVVILKVTANASWSGNIESMNLRAF